MDIVRNADGTLVVPVQPERHHDDDADRRRRRRRPTAPATTRARTPVKAATTRRSPSGTASRTPTEPAVSTPCGREEAMHLVHEVASPEARSRRVEALEDPEAAARRYATCSSAGAAPSRGSPARWPKPKAATPPPHQATKIIGEVLAELD